MDKEKYLAFVAALPLFRDMPEAALRAMLLDPRCEIISVVMKDVILAYDTDAHWLGILLKGEANVYRDSEGGRVLMNVLRPGSLVGAATMFMENARAATRVCAKRRCVLLRVDEELLTDMMREHFCLVHNYLAYLTARVHFLTKRIEEIACPSAADRLMNYLVQNAENGIVTLPRGMHALAESLCMSRATLYRVMNDLVEQKKIKRDGANVYII